MCLMVLTGNVYTPGRGIVVAKSGRLVRVTWTPARAACVATGRAPWTARPVQRVVGVEHLLVHNGENRSGVAIRRALVLQLKRPSSDDSSSDKP